VSDRRIVLLAMDGAEPTLLREWAQAGRLPNLASLLRRGFSGRTHSLPGFFIGSTWPSFYTGTSPARHGFHYQIQLRPGTYDLYRPENEGLVRTPPFWHYLSEAGKRVAILDVPLTPLDPQINGVQTLEWGGHDAVYGFQSAPPPLAQSIREQFGLHPAGNDCDAVRKDASDYRSFVDRLVRGIEQKTKITRQVLQQERWDFFAQVFSETHCVGHQCWHLHDENHPGHDAALAASVGDPLLTVYAAVDKAIGEIVREAGDALVIVMSAHGMGSFYGAQFAMRDILFKLGVTTALPAAPPQREPLWRVVGGAAWRRLPDRVRAGLAPLRELANGPHRHAEPDELPVLGIDPARSRCFPLSNGLGTGGIRLNLVGREPAGIVRPGADAEACVLELTENLLALRDPRNGSRLVREVLRTRAVYDGPQIEALPDLLVEWNEEVPTGSAHVGEGRGSVVVAESPQLGRVERRNTYARTGEHRIEGMFVAVGAGTRVGQADRVISVLDFAPTFCETLGVNLPYAEGHSIQQLVRTAS
jgi:predicted AlkP superfamily phosphohydrolase/phosphomutase